MPRIRTLKPELATDVKLARVSRDARYTFVLLITQADDEGLVAGSPRQLLGTLYPHDDSVSGAMLLAWLEELAEIGVVRWRTTKDGAPVLELVNWAKHQRVDHKGRSQLAAELAPAAAENGGAPKDSRDSRETLAKVSRTDLGPRTRDLGPGTNDQGAPTAGRGRRGPVADGAARDAGERPGRRATPSKRPAADDPGFAEFWRRYPRRTGDNPKRRALRAWEARRRAGVPAAELLAGVDRYRAYVEATDRAGTEFVMQAATFLGPDLRYAEAWELPAGDDGDREAERELERRAVEEAERIEANQRWLAERRGLVPSEAAR